MRMNAPTFSAWVIATLVGGLGLVSRFVPITNVSEHAFWLVSFGFVLLLLSTLLKRL